VGGRWRRRATRTSPCSSPGLAPEDGIHPTNNSDSNNSDQSCIICVMERAPTRLHIHEHDLRIMREHVRSGHAEEVCGLLGGIGNEVVRVIPVENVLHSPYRYRMEPGAQVRAIQTIEDAGLSLVGIYHSHPGGPSGLSSQDLREAAYPEAAYLVWSFTGAEWECRAFRLEADAPREIPIAGAKRPATPRDPGR
jgi:proteasome lid subunit RPN8/RPN11